MSDFESGIAVKHLPRPFQLFRLASRSLTVEYHRRSTLRLPTLLQLLRLVSRCQQRRQGRERSLGNQSEPVPNLSRLLNYESRRPRYGLRWR